MGVLAKENGQNERIIWIDFFKAICILSMVVGHATGTFNAYIYQFHMGAFFFISGFTANLNKRSFWQIVWNKLCTLILPSITIFIVFALVIKAMDVANIYSFFFDTPYQGFIFQLKEFILHNRNWINLLGAAWFLPVLCGINILQKFLYDFSGGKCNIYYGILSITIFFIGYYCVLNKLFQAWDFNLMLVGQGYFYLGNFVKQSNIVCRKYKYTIPFCGICGAALLFIGRMLRISVDYPSRKFGNPLVDIWGVVGGVLFVYAMSKLCEKLPQFFKKAFTIVGQNTMGILLFHFLFFKLATLLLLPMGITTVSQLKLFLPPSAPYNTIWPFYVIISITASVFLWKWLLSFKAVALLLGAANIQYTRGEIFLSKIHIFKFIRKINIQIPVSLIDQYYRKGKEFLFQHKKTTVSLAALCVFVFWPFLYTGVILNDMLGYRLARMSGFQNLLRTWLQNERMSGRIFRFLAPFNECLNMLSSNDVINRAVQAFIVLIAISSFCFFLFKLFRKADFAIFTGVVLIVFLPFTFEHAVPNAFAGLVCMPFIALMISFCLFLKYCENWQGKYYIFSMILFSISLFGYEYMVTFVLLYPIIYIFKLDFSERSFKRLMYAAVIPFSLALTYIVVMLGTQRIGGESYSGTSISVTSIKEPLIILKTLFFSAFPGYFLFNKKYQYLTGYFSDFALFNNDWKSFFSQQILSFRIIIIVAIFAFLIYKLFPVKTLKYCKSITIFIPFLIGLIYSVIPALPNAVTALYQGNVNANFFTILPVSFSLYCSITFSICWICWQGILVFGNRMKAAVLLISVIMVFAQQFLSSTVLEEQQENFNRLKMIESVFNTNTWAALDNHTIFAPDFFVTQNLLAIHNSYWSDLAKVKGFEMSVVKELNESVTVEAIVQMDRIIVMAQNERVVLSKSILKDPIAIPVENSEAIYVVPTRWDTDGSFYRYYYSVSDELVKELTAIEQPFTTLQRMAGSTLETAKFQYGKELDGWVLPEMQVTIHSQNNGVITLEGYFPNEITDPLDGEVLINNTITHNFTVHENNFIIQLDVPPNEDITLFVKSNFRIVPTERDTRVLSFVLSDIQGS